MKKIAANMLLLFMLSGAWAGCKANQQLTTSDISDIVVPSQFDYPTTADVRVTLTVLTNNDDPVPGIGFRLYSALPEDGGEYFGAGITDEQGVFETVLTLPAAQQSIVAVGFMASTEISIKDGAAEHLFGGATAGMFSQAEEPDADSPFSASRAMAVTGSYAYVQPFNIQGVPQNLLHDAVPADFLVRVNTTLPESQKLPISHPDYLSDTNQLNVKIDELADLWVTFVTEGAGYGNSLGYFTYPAGQPPATAADITDMKIIFPNASLAGSGGNLRSGDKLYIGRFPAGTMIGWFMVANGWTGSGVGNGYGRYYSLTGLNPEVNPAIRQHSILVWDGVFQKLMFAFEDIERSSSGCDQDFNDVIFYATVSPVTAVDMKNVQPIDQPVDSDGDGVTDVFDDYPKDGARAFDNYVPSKEQFGTLGFEDLWPVQGDYDFNDVVLGYQINQVTNAKGNVVEVKGSILVRAIGASYANGFGIEFPFAASDVASLTGSNAPSLETSGSQNAVVILLDDVFDVFPRDPNVYINTMASEAYYPPAEITFDINLTAPLAKAGFAWQPPYNPFIYQNRVRSHEIHLPGYTPTAGADQSLFGTHDDTTAPAKSRYYKTAANLPWAINIPAQWDYPLERDQITWGYKAFRNWAQSSGAQYADWYLNNTNYRSDEFIYYVK